LEILSSPEAWASLATLTILEIVLGIDNLVFVSIISQRAEKSKQQLARRVGLILALVTRVLLLLALTWLMGLTEPLFEAFDMEISWRDLILIAGGLFLLYKATGEIHEEMEHESEFDTEVGAASSFAWVVTQIALLDIVFSLDSVLTAVGMADHVPIMVAAIVIAMAIMIFAAEPVSAFIEHHPTVKMLALSFLLLIGVGLIAEGLHFHIPKGYLYFAIFFSMMVEGLNITRKRRRGV
jgi:predicted tellurium resistance membrane protein TerC